MELIARGTPLLLMNTETNARAFGVVQHVNTERGCAYVAFDPGPPATLPLTLVEAGRQILAAWGEEVTWPK